MYRKRRYEEVVEFEYYEYSNYRKRQRRSHSSGHKDLEIKELNQNGSVKASGDGGYSSTRLSQPSRWTRHKMRNRCACHRHSDSGFETKSLRSRKHGALCSRKIRRDEEGHLIYAEGDILNLRYELIRTIGQGTFGKVVLANDLQSEGRRVAIKIVRRDRQDYEDAMLEADIITQLQQLNNSHNMCISLLDTFDYHGHLCIAFELLGHSVYEFMRRNHFQPFPMEDVQKMARQICAAVKFCHDNELVHTDLKPENLLFVNAEFDLINDNKSRRMYRRIRSCDLRLIDFGSAVFKKDHGKGIISTRHYRAPEVILELGWSYPSDVWSIGCMLFELYTGVTLFQTHSAVEHLAMMQRTLGPIPSSFIHKTNRRSLFRSGKLKWDEKSSSGRSVRTCCRPLKTWRDGGGSKSVCFLFDLIERMLAYHPSERITLEEALRHPFLLNSTT